MKDMYGNPIVLLGETGYGISTVFQTRGRVTEPMFTVFHESDGFRQCLYSVIGNPPQITNRFEARMAEVAALSIK